MTPDLVQFEGRVIPREKIVFGGGNPFEADEKADFTPAFRSSLTFYRDFFRFKFIYLFS